VSRALFDSSYPHEADRDRDRIRKARLILNSIGNLQDRIQTLMVDEEKARQKRFHDQDCTGLREGYYRLVSHGLADSEDLRLHESLQELNGARQEWYELSFCLPNLFPGAKVGCASVIPITVPNKVGYLCL
jgi:hypothetical protein